MKTIAATLFAALVTSAIPAAAQQDFSKVEIKVTKLSNTVHFMQGAGGNIAVSAGEDSVFMVDDQYAPLTPKIVEAVAKITPKPVQFVLNTHWHGDHSGGNENLGKAGAIIVAHENVRKRMGSEQFMAFFKQTVPASPKGALPVVTFTGTMTFHLNGEDIRVMHVPNAHTDGDSLVYFSGSDILHMGDVYFNGLYPFIDYDSGGSIDGVIAACDRALGMLTDKSRVIPGHGPVSSREELRAYRDLLQTVMTRVRAAVAEGKTDEQIVQAGLTREFDEKWGKGFMKPDRFALSIASGMRKAK